VQVLVTNTVIGRQPAASLEFVPFQPMRLERSQLDFSQFWQVWDTLESTYVDPGEINQQKLIQGAISGMTAAVGDPYTVYLPPQDNKQSKEDLNGEFDGIGIQLGYKKGTVAVQTPLENHPAIKAGIRAGDLILKITDEAKGIEEETTGMTLNEAVKLIRGKRGTPVTLQFYREDKGTFEETIVRETIVMPSVELTRGDWQDGEFKESNQGKIAWLRVYRFGDNTDNQWDSAISEIAGSRSSISGLVLDLRNNPGGLLESAIDLASEFIPEGLVVKQQGRNDTDVRQVSKRGRLLGMPMTVLINEGSASASEILAGALRDRLGVKLVGQKSFGKGTVQQVVDLSGGSGLHVTVAKWLLPNGDWIHDTGLTPEIEIELPEPATGSTEVVDTQLEAAIKAL
jgi:carboxyl-terminal processing protease